MYVYIHIDISIYEYIYTYIYIHIYIYRHIYRYIYVNIYVYTFETCTYIYIHTYMVNTCLHVHVCMYIYILVGTCMYTYTHTYECMYECMCSQPPCTHTNTLAYPHGLTRTHTNLPSFVTWSQSRLSRQFDRPVSGTYRAGIEYGQSACGRRLWKSQSTSL